ncbi:GGDEF domain-containing protein [Roseateles sp. So40a]|uniref:GGDEF domain-containing protein n=1 Tax=Roseateles sp. So40a TaxID=3400226 RepID=UPI003A8A0B87
MSIDAENAEQLARLRGEISHAEQALKALLAELASARSEERLGAMYWLVLENERLYAALEAQHCRAAEEADSAHAALQDAIRVSETDPLTQLPNRVVLWDRLAHDLDLARRHGTALAVLYLDIDGFKSVNDRLGHEAGDQLLRQVASLLRTTLRASDTVCRMGGDEFVIVAEDVQRPRLTRFVDKIARAVGCPCLVGGEILVPEVSIGASSFPEDGDQPEVLVRRADEDMYKVKRARKDALRLA